MHSIVHLKVLGFSPKIRTEKFALSRSFKNNKTLGQEEKKFSSISIFFCPLISKDKPAMKKSKFLILRPALISIISSKFNRSSLLITVGRDRPAFSAICVMVILGLTVKELTILRSVSSSFMDISTPPSNNNVNKQDVLLTFCKKNQNIFSLFHTNRFCGRCDRIWFVFLWFKNWINTLAHQMILHLLDLTNNVIPITLFKSLLQLLLFWVHLHRFRYEGLDLTFDDTHISTINIGWRNMHKHD